MLFSLSVWAMICLLTSRCKNKVTSVAEPERTEGAESRVESPHSPKSVFTERLSGALENPPAATLHLLGETGGTPETARSFSGQPGFCSPHENQTRLDRFECSVSGASKWELQGFPTCVSAPALPALGVMGAGGAVSKSEDNGRQPTAKSHGNALQLSSDDPVPPTASESPCDLMSAAHRLSGGSAHTVRAERRTDTGNDISTYGKHEDRSGETGRLMYLESHIESTGTAQTATKVSGDAANGGYVSLEEDVGFGKVANCKKSKTWSSFYQPRGSQDSGATINVFNGNKEALQLEPGERTASGEDCSTTTEADDHREDYSTAGKDLGFLCSASAVSGTRDMEMKYRRVDLVSERPLHTEGHIGGFSKGQNHWTSIDHLSECDHDVQSSALSVPRRRDGTKHKQEPSVLHEGLPGQNVGKCHTDSSHEVHPCEMESKVLKPLKTFEKGRRTQMTKLASPSEEELLEERISFPLSKSSESEMWPNAAISSKKPCASLPNLTLYGNRDASVTCATPQLMPKESADNVKANLCNENRSVDEAISSLGLPILDVRAEGLLDGESCLNNVSPNTLGPTSNDMSAACTGRERSGLPSDLEQPDSDVNTEDLVIAESRVDNVPSGHPLLPVINTPAGIIRGEEERLHDMTSSNLQLPVIDCQPECLLRDESRFINVIPSNPGLPAIDEKPDTDVVMGKNKLDDTLFSNSNLPVISVQTEALPSNDCRVHDASPSTFSLPDIGVPTVSENVTKDRSIAAETQSSNHTGYAECGPVVTQSEDQSFSSQTLKSEVGWLIGKQETDTTSDSIDPTNIIHNSDIIGWETIPQTPPKSVETTTDCRQVSAVSESTSAHLQQALSGPGISLSTETQLTPSGSYSNSFQDGDEISEWPKTEDIFKRSSTISLSSNYDILDSDTSLNFKTNTEHLYDNSSEVLQEEHNPDKSANSGAMNNIHPHDTIVPTYGEAGTPSFRCGLFHYEQKAEDRVGSANSEKSTLSLQGTSSSQNVNPKECSKTVSEKSRNTFDTYNTSKEQPDCNVEIPACIDQTEMAHPQSETERPNLDSPVMHDQVADRIDCTDPMQACNLHTAISLDKTVINDQPDNHVGGHLFAPVMNEQAEDHIGREDSLKDFSPLGQAVLIIPAEVPEINDETQEYRNTNNIQMSAGAKQALGNIGLVRTVNERSAGNLDTSDFNHGENSDVEVLQEETGSEENLEGAVIYDALTKNRQKEKRCSLDLSGTEDYGLGKEKTNKCNINGTIAPEVGRAKGGATKEKLLRFGGVGIKNSKNFLGDQKSERDTTPKICGTFALPAVTDHKPGLKEYLSARLSRRPFHSVFAMTLRARTPEGDVGSEEVSTGEEPYISHSGTISPYPVLVDGCTQSKFMCNSPEVLEQETMANKNYLTYLYARSPKLKMAGGSGGGIGRAGDDTDEISVLANLNFCKVAGSLLPVVTKGTSTALDVQKDGGDPILVPTKPDHVYIPPSKEELKADNELSVLNIMCTLKRSLELSEMYNMERTTDTYTDCIRNREIR